MNYLEIITTYLYEFELYQECSLNDLWTQELKTNGHICNPEICYITYYISQIYVLDTDKDVPSKSSI